MDTPNDLAPPNELAGLIGASGALLRRWAREGKLPAYKRGGRVLMSRADVLAMLKRIETSGPTLTPKAVATAKARRTYDMLRKAGLD